LDFQLAKFSQFPQLTLMRIGWNCHFWRGLQSR